MKIQKKIWGWGGGGGWVRLGWGGGRSEVFVNLKKKYFFFWGGGGGARVDVNREVKFL